MKPFLLSLLAVSLLCSTTVAGESRYLLKAELPPGTTSHVTVKVEIGGDKLIPDTEGEKKLPIRVLGNFDYQEQIVAWSEEPSTIARSIRDYKSILAKNEVAEESFIVAHPDDSQLVLAEIRDGLSIVTGGEQNLTREQEDLINVEANTLAIDRLLPGKEMAEGESWTHDAATIGALLCMDHVGVCEVSSVVAAETDRQVQIRLAGTVHGTVEGTPSERELRAAYLFHLDEKRITRFNLAIKEIRKPNDVVAGLDVVAKAFVSIDPVKEPIDVPANVEKIAHRIQLPLSRTLAYVSPSKQFRFTYDDRWYITAEDRDRISFRYLQDHEAVANCIVSVLPSRSAGRHTPLEQFERDVRTLIDKQLEAVSQSTEWDTKSGLHCLGVIAEGQVKDIPMQWRHYLVAADDCPRLSLAVSLERDRVSTFADADRPIIESIELSPSTPGADAYRSPTASKEQAISR